MSIIANSEPGQPELPLVATVRPMSRVVLSKQTCAWNPQNVLPTLVQKFPPAVLPTLMVIPLPEHGPAPESGGPPATVPESGGPASAPGELPHTQAANVPSA